MMSNEDRIMVNDLTAKEVIDRLANAAFKYCGSGSMTEKGKDEEGLQMINDFAWCFGMHLRVEVIQNKEDNSIVSETIDGVKTRLKIPSDKRGNDD
jgi:hypothetical protein